MLLDFDSDTGGADWYAPLLFNSSGKLFGSTVALDYQHAYIFELAREGSGWKFNPIYAGGYCLVFDKVSDLFSCIGSGGIGELSPGSNSWTYTDLCASCTSSAPLSWDLHGNLYGTELYGGNGPPKCKGSAGCGYAFRLVPNGDGTWTYHVLYRFANFPADGYYPYASLTLDASGNAYGVTWAGGKYGNGTFFKLTPTKSGLWKETILYQFPNCASGCGPGETLVSDTGGNLYGSAAGGSTACGYSCGVIYKFSPQTNGTWKYSVVHKFNGNDGAFPYGVVLDGRGNIFGTTMNGGKYNVGVAFEITP